MGLLPARFRTVERVAQTRSIPSSCPFTASQQCQALAGEEAPTPSFSGRKSSNGSTGSSTRDQPMGGRLELPAHRFCPVLNSIAHAFDLLCARRCWRFPMSVAFGSFALHLLRRLNSFGTFLIPRIIGGIDNAVTIAHQGRSVNQPTADFSTRHFETSVRFCLTGRRYSARIMFLRRVRMLSSSERTQVSAPAHAGSRNGSTRRYAACSSSGECATCMC